MENEKFNITVAEGVNEILIREGSAQELLPLREEIPIKITGTIDAPLRFLKYRFNLHVLPPASLCHVIVNKEDGTIILNINERDFFADQITGVIEIDANLDLFGINRGDYVAPESMSNHLKARKHLFGSQAQYTEVFTALRNFRAKVNQERAAIKDDSGNYELKKAQVVDHNIPKSFSLYMPIFKGAVKVKFEVEFIVNNNLEVTLYSTELIQMIDECRSSIIEEVITGIEEVTPDIAIIYQ